MGNGNGFAYLLHEESPQTEGRWSGTALSCCCGELNHNQTGTLGQIFYFSYKLAAPCHEFSEVIKVIINLSV